MKRTGIIILLLLSLQFKAFSQNSINNYKYIIVPTSYGFLGEEDKYQINSLTKFLFNKYGFTAFLQNEALPQDLMKDRCLALYADVSNDKGLFKTKLKIDLKDCGGMVVMSSKVGETREKDFSKAYNLALRDAFETFQNADYHYEPNSKTEASVKVQESEPIAEKEKEIVAPNTDKQVLNESNKAVVEVVGVAAVLEEKPAMEINETQVEVIEKSSNLLYAQPIENGFQVVDTTPKIVMILLETGKSNVFAVKGQNAIVYKEDGFWYMSKNDGEKVSVETLNIKF